MGRALAAAANGEAPDVPGIVPASEAPVKPAAAGGKRRGRPKRKKTRRQSHGRSSETVCQIARPAYR